MRLKDTLAGDGCNKEFFYGWLGRRQPEHFTKDTLTHPTSKVYFTKVSLMVADESVWNFYTS
jgi:hypothetical protein